MKRTKIKELLQMQPQGQSVLVQGWVRSRRDSKEVSFLIINDGSCMNNAQAVLSELFIQSQGDGFLSSLGTGACVGIWGVLQPSQGKGQASDIIPEKVVVYGEGFSETFPLQKKGVSLEVLRSIAHMRVRSNTFSAVFRVRHAAAYAIHKFFNDKGFYYAHTPIITASDCEGAGEMFAVTTLNMNNLPKNEEGQIDYSQDFFGKPAHLTVSGQLNGELLAMGLSEIYTFGPTFRAENSNTARHLAEFWMIEPEMAFYEAEDNQALAEEFIKAVISHVQEHCMEDLKFFDQFIAKGLIERLEFVLKNPFQKIDYTEAISILEKSGKKFEYPVKWGIDMQSEHERWLVEEHFKKPVIVINYPKEIKAFYMKQNADGKTVRAMDVLFPGIGEIIGGSQREENYEKLLARIRELGLKEEDYWWYLETRKFGTAPHSGFGLGFERLMLFLTGMANIRDVIPFPRTPGNAEF